MYKTAKNPHALVWVMLERPTGVEPASSAWKENNTIYHGLSEVSKVTIK
jgi:hypothetical protein